MDRILLRAVGVVLINRDFPGPPFSSTRHGGEYFIRHAFLGYTRSSLKRTRFTPLITNNRVLLGNYIGKITRPLGLLITLYDEYSSNIFAIR